MELIPTKQEVEDFIKEHTIADSEKLDMLDKDNFMPSLQELYERGY